MPPRLTVRAGKGPVSELHSRDPPVGHDMSPQMLVEFDGRGVPVQNRPFRAGTAPFLRKGEEVFEKGSAETSPAQLGPDIHVLEPEAGLAGKGGKGWKDNGEPGKTAGNGRGGCSGSFRNEGFRAWGMTEEGVVKVSGSRGYGVAQLFIGRQVADE